MIAGSYRTSIEGGAAAGRSGLTMIELLAAMTILATLGVFLTRILGTSFDLYDQGDVRGDVYLNSQALIERVEEDLLAVHGGVDGRLLIEPDRFGPGTLFIRLVRSVPGGESDHAILRKAGTANGASATWNGGDPENLAEIAPPSGLMEVAWALIQEDDRPTGVLSLYRGVRAPALIGADSFFAADIDDSLDHAWVRSRLQVVGTDVLGMWVLSLGQTAIDWNEEEALDGRPASGGALPSWDSTRAILDKTRFAMAIGASSLREPRDDIFPRQMRIVLAVGRGDRPETRLARSLVAGEQGIVVRSNKKLPPEAGDDRDRFIKVGNEWISISGDGGRLGAARELRGSKTRNDYPASTPVYAGYTFRKSFRLPAAKSFWMSEDSGL